MSESASARCVAKLTFAIFSCIKARVVLCFSGAGIDSHCTLHTFGPMQVMHEWMN